MRKSLTLQASSSGRSGSSVVGGKGAKGGGRTLRSTINKQLEVLEKHDQLTLAPLVKSGVLRVVSKPMQYCEEVETKRLRYPKVEPNHIYLVGTCHVSEDSAKHVKDVIEAVMPQAVVVELCSQRQGILNWVPQDNTDAENQQKEEEQGDGLRKSSNRKDKGKNVKGRDATLLQENWIERTTRSMVKGVLDDTVVRIASDIGVFPGVEMRQAAKSAASVDALLVLGDRPIDITLQRCWSNLSLQEKVKVFSSLPQLVMKRTEIAESVAEDIGQDIDFDLMLQQMTSVMPGLVEPLLKERERYMAWVLKKSKAVTDCDCVVGVIGQGHLSSVFEEIEKDYHSPTNLTFKKVARFDN